MHLCPISVSPLLAELAAPPRAEWAAVVLLIVVGIGFAAMNLTVSILVGPKRTGKGKEATYESGMVPIGDAHRRFNVRFYVVAMIFLVFDVDVIFFYPFCTIFQQTAVTDHAKATVMLLEMMVFVVLLLVAYFYAWGKGVFRWD
jgi:NADH-quinone oxidoreductase subunit A